MTQPKPHQTKTKSKRPRQTESATVELLAPTASMRSKTQTAILLGLALLVVGAAYLWNLNAPHLWGDEAATAEISRNLLKQGVPTAYDGRNLMLYGGGGELNGNLLAIKLPWVQYYLCTISMRIFGESTFGARAMFALVGLAALVPVWLALRSKLRYPLLTATLLLISPQVVLFHRNARYYAALTVAYAVLIWLLGHERASRAQRLSIGTICFVLLFHTHPVAAAATAVSVVLFQALRRSPLFFEYLIASGTGFLSWFIWYRIEGPLVVKQEAMLTAGHLSEWLGSVMTSLGAGFLDLDAINALPLIGCAALLGIVWISGARGRLRELLREPLFSVILLNLAVQVVISAVLFKPETDMNYSLVRYMPHLIAFSPVPVFLLVQSLARERPMWLAACGLILVTNLLTISFWTQPAGRQVPASWWGPTYAEIVRPGEDVWDEIPKVIDKVPRRDAYDTLAVAPPWAAEVAVFYLGDRLLTVPSLEPGSPLEAVLKRVVDPKARQRFSQDPTWIIDFAGTFVVPPNYERVEIPAFLKRPDDGTRPELIRHSFQQESPVSVVYVYRLKSTGP